MRALLLTLLLTAAVHAENAVVVAGSDAPPDSTPWKAETLKKLKRHVSFEFKDTPLEEAIQFLNSLTKVNINFDPKIAAEGANKTTITATVKDAEMDVALKWLLNIAGLEYDLREYYGAGGLFITKRGIPATQAKLTKPFAVAFDKTGNMYIAEMEGGERIVRVDPKGILTTIAGSGLKGNSGDGGPAAQAEFNGMHNILIAPDDTLYVADSWNNRIRKIDLKTGVISAFAGTGVKGFSGDDGPALKAEFSGVFCIAMDAKGETLYVDDIDNRRVRAIDMKTGIVRTIAGNGEKGVPADGSDAKTSPLVDPRAIAVDSKGNLYLLERGGNALRVIGTDGKIRTVAGTGKSGASGDGGPALQATMKGPKHICVDGDDNVLIADTDNHVIRKFNPKDGTISHVAGTGTPGPAGVGGPLEKVQLNQPHGVYVRAGVLYISDAYNNRVLKTEW